MKKINLFIYIFIVLLFTATSVFAASKYRYVCDNDICYNTRTDYIWPDSYYVNPVERILVSSWLTNTIDDSLIDYSNYYWTWEFTIEDFCPSPCWSWDDYDENFTLSWIINYSSDFDVTDGSWPFPDIIASYSWGLDYLFENFNSVITELNTNAWLPIWTAKNNLSDILSNIVNYSTWTNEFELRNICDYQCSNSLLTNYIYWDSSEFRYLSWTIQLSNFVENTFIVSWDYSIVDPVDTWSIITVTKVWDSVLFNFWFEDFLDWTDTWTTYTYTMIALDENDPLPTSTWSELEVDVNNLHWFYLNESITIDNDTYEVSSEWLWDALDDVISINVKDDDTKYIEVRISEPISLIKAWQVNFYLMAVNDTSWDSFPLTIINPSLPVTVLPRDEIASVTWAILSPFNLIANETWFGQNQPFPVEFLLKDSTSSFYNVKSDEISWYTITKSAGSSPYLELSTSDDPDWVWSDRVDWIISDTNDLNKFYFRITEPGYYDIYWFDITARKKEDTLVYSEPAEYEIYNNFIPWNLYDTNWTLNKIYIEQPAQWSLVFQCWYKVDIKYDCIGDNLSGCYQQYDLCIDWSCSSLSEWEWYSFTSESENGKNIQLTVRDLAYNTTVFEGIINHIDTTAPEIISIVKWTENIIAWNSYKYLANNDDLVVKFYEKTTNDCIAKTYYKIYSNDSEYSTWVLDWVNSELDISNLFKTTWTYNLKIDYNDQYWNTWSIDFDYTIKPNLVDISYSSVYLTPGIDVTGEKFANNIDNYNYTLELIDWYNNEIYNKTILSLDTKCVWDDCKTIKTDLWVWWNDAIIEYNNTWDTDSNWKFTFNVKWLAPGTFSEVFKIKLKDWNTDYNDETNISEFYIWSNINYNSFKKPISWNMNILEWGTAPELWKEQKYWIHLDDIDWNWIGVNDWRLELTTNSISNLVDWHFWAQFIVENERFNSNLNNTLSFSWVIDTDNDSTALFSPKIEADKLIIDYNLWWENIRYYLDSFWINWCAVNTLWLKVIWTLQWDWKSDITWQDSNFSDLTKGKLRSQIRKNAYKLMRNRISWLDNINNIIYIQWDKSYSEVKPYLNTNDTIIIRNWNFIIDEDILNNIGVIVLKSNYLLDSDYINMWNVYVNNDVEEINAIIYADWAFRSADSNWNSYNDSSLNKRLVLNWSLFTRNTIWWAVRWDAWYLLPWWGSTNSFDLAEVYDLNYIRKVDNTCDLDNDYSFLIKYNPSVQLNPPKWFDIKY